MSQREITELVCDACGRSDQGPHAVTVLTRQVAVDGVAVEAELCDDDWAGLMASFAVFATHGRRVPTKTRVVGAKQLPGSEWRWSAHALVRLGERKIDPMQIVKMLEAPEVTRPGNATDLTICEGKGLKAVVAFERGIVITVARHDETDGAMVEGASSRG